MLQSLLWEFRIKDSRSVLYKYFLRGLLDNMPCQVLVDKMQRSWSISLNRPNRVWTHSDLQSRKAYLGHSKSSKINRIPYRLKKILVPITYSEPDWDKVNFVENEDKMFVGLLFLHIALDLVTPCAKRISRVQHLYHHVWGIDHLCQQYHCTSSVAVLYTCIIKLDCIAMMQWGFHQNVNFVLFSGNSVSS